MSDFVIYIPTRGRIDHQPTYEFLSLVPGLEDKIRLVVRPDEVDAHRSKGRKILVRPEDKTIHHVWEWMKNQCETPYFFIADDDLRFFRRVSPEDWHLRKCAPEDVADMMEEAVGSLQGFIHGTLSARQGNNNQPSPFNTVGRANAFHFFNTKAVQSKNLDMSLSGLHDIHTTLTLLEQGYPNYIITEFCWDQSRGSNAPGGCSLYRDGEWQRREVLKLKELHPEFVTVVEKKPKIGWGQGMTTRTDVRVSWAKAMKHGEKQR